MRDDIEVRMCSRINMLNENIGVDKLEIYTFASPEHRLMSAEWCADQTVIAFSVFSICIRMCTYIVVFELICTINYYSAGV